ncbi:MAG: hypothetical protein LBE91_17830 [Tannerella sp.]|jgi:uncharacterized membrane protein|nr:hypothetical protein [Tannerella sp.]
MAKQMSKSIKINSKERLAKPVPFFVLGLVFIVLSVFISFSPDITRGWGFNYIRFFAPPVIIFYYVLLFCFWFPPVNQLIVRYATKISRANILAFGARYKYLLFVLVSIAFGFAFHFLKIKYIFLGDLDIRAKQIEEGVIMNDEYFTMLFFKHVYLFLHSKFEFTGIQTIRLFDYITGSLFIFISLCTSNLLGNTFLKKLSLFLIGTLSCTIILQFCGYTDVYALAVLFLALYLFTSVLHLKGKVGIYLPFIVLLAGIGFHLLLVCLFPSFIYLFYRNVLWKYPLFRKKSTIITLLLIASPFLFIAVNKFAIPKIMPFRADDSSLMTLFSVSHWKEFTNSQVLASGIGFFLWLIILLHSLLNRIKYDAIQWFLLLSSVSIVGLMFVFNALRGSGDWDILAFTALAYNLSNVYYLLSLHDKKLYNNIKYGIAMLACFSILHTSFWIATNKTNASIGWIERAIENDPAHYYKNSFSNEAMLAAMFGANNMEERSLKWHRIAYKKQANDPRMGFNFALMLINRNQKAEAIAILNDVINKFPLYPLPYPQLANIYIENKDYESLYHLLVKMETAYNGNPDVFNSRLTKETIEHLFSILKQLKVSYTQ